MSRDALGKCMTAETLDGRAFMDKSNAGVLILNAPPDCWSAAVPREFRESLIKRGS